ncbi:hypothetical protein DNTS_015756 [Danionella cerebrum]|uniref:Amino acid transporter transmembrane domain-containing protein n=1 Tax=Danionella cerebrum TaxID=2873325 RepID=A0A553MQ25_9TELE|nr:hypothetical protein DNTS_015756 [Danionella translucida]
MVKNAQNCSVQAESEYEPIGEERRPLLGQDARAGGASFMSSAFNLMNAIMGSGILGLSFAMANTGIIGFSILLMVVASLAAFSIHLLLLLCDQTGINSYEALGEKAFNRPGKFLVACTILIQNIGAMSSYLFIFKSEMPAAINGFISTDTSGVPGVHQQPLVPVHALLYCSRGYEKMVHSLPAASKLHEELGTQPSKLRMQRVTNVGIFLSFVVYLISALFGYLTFYKHVESELLLGYDHYLPRDVLVMSVRIAILLAVLLTVPLIHFPARKALLMVCRGERPFSWVSHTLACFFILTLVLLLAIFVPDIRNVFGVIGSTTSTCLLFVYPGMFYLRISSEPITSLNSIGVSEVSS